MMTDRLGYRCEYIPEEFEERLLQARLVTFWKTLPNDSQPILPEQQEWCSASDMYDPAVAEERYERFQKEFLANLPDRFALGPKTNKEWDESHPRLPLQRHMLHITIFDSICHNFKRLLLLESSQIRTFPRYKQELVLAHVQTLALAAVKVLDGVSALHSLIGGTYTRCPDIIFYTFEAAVILVCISIKRPDALSSSTSEDDDGKAGVSNSSSCDLSVDPVSWTERCSISLERCIQAAKDALRRLEMLAEVSGTAEIGARHLARLIELRRSINGGGDTPAPAAPLSVEVPDGNTLGDCTDLTSFSAQVSTVDSASETLVSAIEAEVNNNFDLSWESLDFSHPSHFDTLFTDTT